MAGSHYESCSDLVTAVGHFGLGKHSVVDKIEVMWPSGVTTSLTNVTVNQTITITEE